VNLKFYPPHYLEEPFRFGDYELVSLLGSGGMGQVFEARRVKEVAGELIRIRGAYALKLPSIQLLRADPHVGKQMLLEARAASQVDHVNVVSLFDVGEVEGIPYLTMDLLSGEGLEVVLARGALAPAKVLEVGIAMAAGLAAIHEAGLVHRDVKPSNVFMTTDGGIKLLDLGIAKAVDAQSRLTGTGMSKGTPGYMAPEQLVPGVSLDSKVDLFSLGAVLAELALGEPVFYGETLIQLLMLMPVADKHVAAQSIQSRVDAVCPGLGDVVVQCLRTEPSARPASAAAIHGLLEALRDGQAPVQEPVSTPPSAPDAATPPAPTRPVEQGSVSAATRPIEQPAVEPSHRPTRPVQAIRHANVDPPSDSMDRPSDNRKPGRAKLVAGGIVVAMAALFGLLLVGGGLFGVAGVGVWWSGDEAVPEAPPAPSAAELASAVATVDGTAISEEDFIDAAKREESGSGGPLTADDRLKIVDDLVTLQVLYLEALERGFQQEPEVRKIAINSLLRSEIYKDVKNTDFPDAELEAWFRAHRSEFGDKTFEQMKGTVLRNVKNEFYATQTDAYMTELRRPAEAEVDSAWAATEGVDLGEVGDHVREATLEDGVARAAGVVITAEEVASRMVSGDEARTATEALASSIDDALLLKAAVAAGHLEDPKVRKVLVNLFLREEIYDGVKNEDFPEEQLRSYFDANRESFVVPEKIQIKRIFLVGDDRSPLKALAELSAIRDQLVTSPDRFGELATAHSEDPYSRRGGDLGYISREGKPGIPSKVVEVAFGLEIGSVSQIFETEEGWNLVSAVARRDRVERTFDQMRGSVLRKVKNETYKTLTDAFLDSLRAKSEIHVYEERALAATIPKE